MLQRQPGIHRLFVGAYPALDSTDRMLACLNLFSLGAHVRTKPEHLHVTLQFIGDTAPRRAEEVLESVRRSAAGIAPFELQPTRVRTLPEIGPPRLVALETSSPGAVIELHRRLAHRLAKQTRNPDPTNDPSFRPHLTLCRFEHEARPDPIDTSIELPPFKVASVRVMKSLLRPGGATHELVEEVRLSG